MDEKRLEEVRERVESVTTETRGCRHCALGLHDRAFLLSALDEALAQRDEALAKLNELLRVDG